MRRQDQSRAGCTTQRPDCAAQRDVQTAPNRDKYISHDEGRRTAGTSPVQRTLGANITGSTVKSAATESKFQRKLCMCDEFTIQAASTAPPGRSLTELWAKKGFNHNKDRYLTLLDIVYADQVMHNVTGDAFNVGVNPTTSSRTGSTVITQSDIPDYDKRVTASTQRA